MTVRPPRGFELPELVSVANRVLTDEAADLTAALDRFSRLPRPFCAWEQDDRAWSSIVTTRGEGRARLLRYTRHQAALTYVNAYDHLLALARVLGGDGAMSLLSHSSLSRVVCEAAVRVAWLMDRGIGSDERVVRGAVALFLSAEERYKAVRRLPSASFTPGVLKQLVASCNDEREKVEELIAGAGLAFAYSRNGKNKARLELESPQVSVPLKLDITELTAELLPDSPSWYNIGSSVIHSYYWGLRDVDSASPGGRMALAPNVLDVGAAVESAISASGLIIDRVGRYYGHDPSVEVQRTRERRQQVDVLMIRAARSGWAYVPTGP